MTATIVNQNFFMAKLKGGAKVCVRFALNEKGKALPHLYFIEIDAMEPVLFDVSRCVEQSAALYAKLTAIPDRANRETIVKKALALVNTEFILKNITEVTA